jgi:hypothetical protein
MLIGRKLFRLAKEMGQRGQSATLPIVKLRIQSVSKEVRVR